MCRKKFPVPVRCHEQSLQCTVNGKENVPESYSLVLIEPNAQLVAKASLVGAVDDGVGLEADAPVPLEDVPGGAEDKHDVKTKVPVEVAVYSRPFEVQE